MIVELSSCTVDCEIDYCIMAGEPGCKYIDGSYHPKIPDEIDIYDIKIKKITFNSGTIINETWLKKHLDWNNQVKSTVEEQVLEEPYFQRLMNENN